MPLTLLGWVLAIIVLGSVVYCLLVILAAFGYVRVEPPVLKTPYSLSVLKPLAGLDDGLEENLRSFFEQDYPQFEILFAVRLPDDPAVAVVERLRADYPHVATRLILTGEPPYPNAKVFSLDHLTRAARSDVLVMSDSDVRVTPGFLSVIAAEFTDPIVGVSTCPYRAIAGASFWSRLEALGMNTEFTPGVLVARMLEGMRFALGPTITARRYVLERIGGWDYLKDFLAEDFVLGHRAAEMGFGVLLSSYVIEHRIGSEARRANFTHRLRWNRSTRRSRPAGYIGQVFTNPMPAAVLMCALEPESWPVLVLGSIVRLAAAHTAASMVLHDPISVRRLWLVPVQDIVSFGFWVAGFFGRTVDWRGRRYLLHADGRFELVNR